MFDLFHGLQHMLPHLKLLAVVASLLLVIIALAAVVYIAHTAFRPLVRVVQFMVAYTPGEKPGEILSGLIFGARMLAWAALIGVVVWYFLH